MSLEVSQLLHQLEEISRSRPDRVLRLRGVQPQPAEADADPAAELHWEPFELLIFRGFSSSISHPTAFDPDQPALPPQAQVQTAELLQAPLNPSAEECLAGPLDPLLLLDTEAWH